MSPGLDLPWEAPLGASPTADGRTRFRVWAPRAGEIALDRGGARTPLEPQGHGVFTAEVPGGAGADYAYAVDGELLPDPCTRWQPDGLRGRSRVLDPAAFAWTDDGWETPSLRDLVISEIHVGTFSAEGTFEGAIPFLPALRDVGITAIEVMPVAEFPGRHGWGYDGVYLSAAHSAYGGPLGFQKLVDAAHAAGLAVILDVVYNHLGASGVNAMEAFGPYFTEKYGTPWGMAVNLDDAESDPVREWILQSAERWVRDFHVDGLRLDAIHALFDSNPEHIVAAIARRVHTADPRALVIAESGLNDPKVMRPRAAGGWACDAAWADDFHHALRVALTGDTEGWYGEFEDLGTLAKAFRRPHVHDGTYSTFRKRRFGAPADDVAPEAFVVFGSNHDQVGNRPFGDRPPAEGRPLAALLTCLAPFTPMLFQGEEYGETAPFLFFSDHIDEEIATATREGRRAEFAAFTGFGEDVPDPQDPATFERSKLTRTGEPRGLRDLVAAALGLRAELAAHPEAEAEVDERRLTVRRGPYRILANFGDRAWPVDGEVLLTAGEVRDGALSPFAGAVVR
ncbi:MAG TPA: malto-oligosyltrehalose trehalohydrolase [Solirubrobacteraceae bacterium]|nr:malto-oligosyltrehalose trehalohydrolase [Solirubrobacteraceae bacterium]